MRDAEGLDWVELAVQVVLAVIWVMAAAALYGRSKTSA